MQMKLNTLSLVVFGSLIVASPVMAQGDDATVSQGAGVIAWIVVGLIGGFLASKIVNKTGEGMVRDIILGICGGIVGGIIFRALGGHGVSGINIGSIVVAFIGSVIVLFLYHTVRGRRA
jgi:uncharacterized membrane protein YeaQ/YmgE (transglycosylase-associated protein family)